MECVPDHLGVVGNGETNKLAIRESPALYVDPEPTVGVPKSKIRSKNREATAQSIFQFGDWMENNFILKSE